MDRVMMKKITLNEYTIAKKEFEIANIYLSDTYKYVHQDLHHHIRNAQEILNVLARAMEDQINLIENSGQPEKK